MSSFTFEYKFAFLLIPLFWFCLKKCPAKGMAIYLPYIQVLIGSKAVKNIWVDITKWLGIISLVTALASPVIVTTYNNIKKDSRDIMLIVDSSTSMLERGFDNKNLLRDKFSVVMDVVKDFINKRKDDRIGIVNFADSAYIASPLTFDKHYLKMVIDRQKVGIAGKNTAIYDALLQSLYILSNSKAKNKIAILLTDGKDTKSVTKYQDIIKLLKKSKVKLYTIGVTQDGKIDAKKLKELSDISGGEFFITTNKKELSKIYKKIDKIETTKIKAQSYKKYKYYYFFPLIFAILFLTLFIYLKSIKGLAK